MRTYHHYGIPTEEERKDETLVEVVDLNFIPLLLRLINGIFNGIAFLKVMACQS